MNPAELDQRVRLERLVLTPDGQGGNTKAWQLITRRWARVEPLTGRERDMAQQTEAPRNYRITLRHDSVTGALIAANRVVWRDKPMQIRFIADAGPRPLYITIDCEAGVTT